MKLLRKMLLGEAGVTAAPQDASDDATTASDHAEPEAGEPSGKRTTAPQPTTLRDQIHAAAGAAFEELQQASQPAHLLGSPGFEHCVELMRASPLSDADLFSYFSGDTVVLAVCAAEAMARRPVDTAIRKRLLLAINDFHPYSRFFGLRAITAATPATESAVGAVLSALDDSWQTPHFRQAAIDFIEGRLAAGDPPTLASLPCEPSDETCENLNALLGPLDDPRITAFCEELTALQANRVDITFLESIGNFWSASDADTDTLIEHEQLAAARARMLAALSRSPIRPVLIVGAAGTGRTSLIRATQRAFADPQWRIWEAGQLELMAGQSHLGQLEERLRQIARDLSCARQIVWLAPAFDGFLFAGRHQANPTSVIDQLLPLLAEGRFPFVGVTEPSGFDLLVRAKPALASIFEVIRLQPLTEHESLDLAREWDRKRPCPPERLDDSLLEEASHLAQQHLGDHAGPGHLINLLKLLLKQQERSGAQRATLDDLIECVAEQTHLPKTVLDDREQLELGSLQAFFAGRVIGQSEAVQTIVERIAMIKAGVTDPDRPMGVFLFAGPTGTGKTEIAKTLAEYLFGSPSRLVRVDMSELQTAESLDRLLGVNQPDQAGQALTDQIRRNPFSVVLLDEFEKAHPQVWDVFLQVFDDGRLTDRRGTVTNFRNCIIILTSNLGAAIPRGPGLGFAKAPLPATNRVEQAIAETFRPEFINRIDRVVVFRPLSRDVLREILHKELRDIFERRGLRNRDWAVIWDDTAVDFLLDRGTTPDLGARPLKRAIEQHVLAPLAKTIVQHTYPSGDQFLFVRGGGDRLEVEFVDPDADDAGAHPPAAPTLPPAGLSLARVAAEPHGTADEAACLEHHLAALRSHLETEDWQARKQTALDQQREPGFWESAKRFAVFGLIEQIDRIESGLASSSRVFERLRGTSERSRAHVASEQLGRLALRLLMLKIAIDDVDEARPLDAFVLLEATATPDAPLSSVEPCVTTLAGMYQAWAARRGIKIDTLLEESDQHTARVVFAVSGLAAHTVLAEEAGIHVFEEPQPHGTGFARRHVLVRVAPQPEVPPSHAQHGLRQQALDCLSTEGGPAATTPPIVRRYREQPSPLVRDAVRGWRTGRIDRVYAGDFDLLAEPSEVANDAAPGKTRAL